MNFSKYLEASRAPDMKHCSDLDIVLLCWQTGIVGKPVTFLKGSKRQVFLRNERKKSANAHS